MNKIIPIFNLDGEKVNTQVMELLEVKPNMDVIHRYVSAFLSNQRLGTASTKTRAEVSGSGRKPWRQKGTGRARVGSIRSPLWRHGGIVFGPKPRDYNCHLPDKMKRIALRDALTALIGDDGLVGIDISDGIKNPKTKIFSGFLKKIGLDKMKVLVVIDRNSAYKDHLIRCIRNIENLSYCYAEQINPYLILTHERIIAQKEILSLLKKRLSSGEENV
ncbi:MAG: 50S ribosomal protein L4 [Candidatus Omnitrophica bacterium]|nr:50S ribosomal protein L4 [Candidatus Omnitrophota bacterium]MCM8788633.1 50S ribosomal protein L4 [Candidatus Omnitrophota bacterium]